MSLGEEFRRGEKEREESGSTIDLQTLIVPYLDTAEDGNPETASLKWAILGTYALKDHEKIRTLLQGYEQELGTIESDKLQELISTAYNDYNTKIHLISWSDKDNALADLATWNDEIETQEEAYNWLEKHGYDTEHYATPWKDKSTKPSKSEDHDNSAPQEGETEPDKAKTESLEEASEPKPAEWVDEHWENKSVIHLLRSALVQKYEQMQGFKISAMEEVNSDVPTGLYAAASATPLMEFSPAASAITAFGLGIGGAIFYDKTTVEKEFHDILKVLSNHRKNRSNPETRDQALELLQQEKDKLNIKLANVKPVDKDVFKKNYTTFVNIAYEKGYLTRPNTNAAVIDESTQRLHSVQKNHAKEIAKNLSTALKAGGALSWTALKTSVKRWKDPVALASGTINGFKAVGINAADMFGHSKRVTSRQKSDITLKGLKTEMKSHGYHGRKMPTVETMYTEKTLETLKEAQIAHDAQIDRHENIDTYRKRQPFNLAVFSMASGLTGSGFYDLYERSSELYEHYATQLENDSAAEIAQAASETPLMLQDITETSDAALQCLMDETATGGLTNFPTQLFDTAMYEHIIHTKDILTNIAADPQMHIAAQEMMQSAVTDNWIGIFTNAWGILLGGIAALGATGQKYYDDTKALRSEFAKADNSLETLVEYQHSLRRLAEDQARKAGLKANKETAQNTRIRFGQNSTDHYSSSSSRDHSEGDPLPPQQDHSNE